MERIARHLAAIAVAVTLIVVVTVSMASAAQSPEESSGKVVPQPGIVASAEGVRLDPAASADIQSRLSSAIGAPANPLGVSALAATPVIEDSIRYWTDGRNPATLLDLSKLTLAITEFGRLSILIDFNPTFDKMGIGSSDSLWILLDTDHNTQTGTNFGGILGLDNVIVFENVGGFRAKVFRTTSGIPGVLESSWTANVSGNSVSAEIPLSSLHNSEELVFLLASIDNPGSVVDVIPDSGVGIYTIDPAWLTPVTTTTTLATTTTTLPTTTTTLATTTTTLPPSTTTTTVPSATFTDVPPSHPYFLQINDMASRHVVDGYGSGLFGPEDLVLRQQFAKMVVIAMGYPVSEANICLFADVDRPLDNLYPDNYIAVAAARGITVGLLPGLFAPWNDISRAQLITMVARAAELADPPAGYVPPFANFSNTHYPWARKAAYAGLLSGLQGMGAGYDFWSPATRGEVCVVLYNLVNR
jgi:hypothetical protein